MISVQKCFIKVKVSITEELLDDNKLIPPSAAGVSLLTEMELTTLTIKKLLN